MKRTHLWIAGLSSLLALAASPLLAEDRPVAAQVATNSPPNAAVIYWSAFGVMPSLSVPQREAIRNAVVSTEAIPEQVQGDLGRYAISLKELHRATRVEACDWGLDNTAGPMMLLPHCQHARDLSAAGLLRARIAFAKGENAAAINDVLAVLRLARDCGRDPVTIALLVNVAIERQANLVLAAHLSQLTPSQLDDLRQRIQALPATQNAAAAFRFESDLYASWVTGRIDQEAAKNTDSKAGGRILAMIQAEAQTGDAVKGETEQETKRRRELIASATVDELRSMVQTMQADYAELARIADLPFPDRAAQFAKFDAGLAKSRQLANRDDLRRVLSIDFLPSYVNVSQRLEESSIRRQLVELAIRVQRDGRDSIRGTVIHGVEVKYEPSGTGFQLTYQLPGAEKPEVLTVPGK